MKRVFIVVVGLGLAACEKEIPGITCHADNDCELGHCVQGICTECSPKCSGAQDCMKGACVAAFSNLALTAPAANATLTLPFKVTATLSKAREVILAAPPSSLSLSAKPASGVAESFTLDREGETLTYSKTISPKASGSYSLSASFAEAGLTSAAVSVTIRPVTCEPACGALEDCVGTTCIKAFEKIEITSPVADANITDQAIGIATEARIVRSAGSTREFPASANLSGTSEGGQTASATLASNGDGTYSGKLVPTIGGKCTLTAASDSVETESEPVAVVVEYCPQGCTTWEECSVGKCVAAFTAIAVAQPTEGSTVGGSAEVRAVVTRRAGGSLTAPATVEVETVKGATTAKLTLSQDAAKPLEYTATWNAAEGAYTLTASTPAVAQPSATINVTVDKTAPTFTVTVKPAPSRNAWELDDKSSTKAIEFKRNEKATVRVESADLDVDTASVKVAVDGPTAGKVEVTPGACSPAPASGYCGEAVVDLGDKALEMKAFRGTAKAIVSGSDKVGNAGTAGPADIAVTRFKWKVDPDPSAPGKTLQTAPAIGDLGNVYLATSTGRVVSLLPDGTARWSVQAGGAISASVAVHDIDSVETAFVAGVTGGVGAVWALNDGNVASLPAPTCSDGSNSLGSIAITEVAIGTETQVRPTAVVGFSQGSGGNVYGVRPGAGTKSCTSLALTSMVAQASGFAVKDMTQVFFGDQDGNIQKVEFVTAGLVSRWTQLVGNGNQPTNPVVSGAGIGGGGGGVGIGALFKVPFTGGSSILGQTDSPTWNAIEIAGPKFVAGSNKGSLYIEDEAFPSSGANRLTAAATLTGALTGAPAFGSDKVLYVASSDKKLYVRDSLGAALWDADLGAASYSSPALDCARDSSGQRISAPGVVYIGADDGFLYAFVTDGHGLDVDSPWPKFHRDPKNRANTGFDLTAFRCP